jgi:hypothetical protein
MAAAGLGPGTHSYQGSAPGPVSPDSSLDLGQRCTVADRYKPLGSGGVWTKCGPSRAAHRIAAHADGFGACHTAASAGGLAPPVDRVVGEALQMAGGQLTGTLKLLKVVSARRRPAGTVPRAQLASGYTIPGGA